MALFDGFDDIPDPPKKTEFDPLHWDCPPTENLETAEMAVVLEIPNLGEVRAKEPMVGSLGAQFNRLCSSANLPRHTLYLTHACKGRVPRDNTNKLWTAKGYRHPKWGEMQEALIKELSEFPGDMIILMGDTPMKLLFDDARFTSVNKFAGSVYKAEEFPHLAKRLPGKMFAISHHPSSTMPRKQPKNTYIIIAHLMKFKQIADDPSLLDIPLNLITRPSYHQTIETLTHLLKNPTTLGFDIEAVPAFVTCVGFGWETPEGLNAITIPFIDNKGNYWSLEEELEILNLIAQLLESPDHPIIAQNGMFDTTYMLRTFLIKTDAFVFDTMIAQHICYTDLPKGLDFLTAFYTYFPYYKDEGKTAHAALLKDWDMYWQYNAKDAVYLLPIAKRLQQELVDFEATDAMDYSMDLHKPLIEMEWNGILADVNKIEAVKKKYKRYLRAMNKGLRKLTGQPLNINSPKQMVAYFYGTLGIKPYVNKRSGNASCDALALSRIAKRGKAGAAEARLIMRIRYYSKLVSTYFEINFDKDNRLRCHHKIAGTTSGRIATAGTFFGTGANLQNQPKIFKRFLIADDGMLICEVDLARAEAHAVAYQCQDESMIHAFESGVDVHTFNASKIFNTPMEKVTKGMRNMGKKVVHARNYKMGPGTFSDNLAKTFIFYSMSKCRQLLEAYSARFPGLDRWQRQIEQTVKTTRVLHNMFGRPKRFLGLMNDALIRNAISFIPQSTVAELLNRGAIKMSEDPRLGVDGYNIDLLTTVHDSVVFQFPIAQAENLLQILLIVQDHMTHVFTHKGRSFAIGLDATIGRAWAGDVVELSEFTQEEVDKALVSLGV